MPSLSVLIPTYNRARWLKECVDSVLCSRLDLEVVVSDNASTDETRAIMEAYTDRRVRYFRQAENQGSTKNFEFLLSSARGDCINVLNDDDRVIHGGLEVRMAILANRRDIDLVHSLWDVMDESGTVLGTEKRRLHMDHSYVGDHREYPACVIKSFIQHQSVIFRRSVLLECGGFSRAELPIEVAFDWDMMIRYTRNRRTAFLCQPTVEVRMHPQSMSNEVGRRGCFLRDMFKMWNYWLVTHDEPATLNDAQWQMMAGILEDELTNVFGKVEKPKQPYREGFLDLRKRYLERARAILEEAVHGKSDNPTRASAAGVQA